MQSTHLHQFFGIPWQPKNLKRRNWVTLPAHNSVAFNHLLRRNFNTFMVKQDFEESSLLGNHRGFQPTVMIWLGMTRPVSRGSHIQCSTAQHSTADVLNKYLWKEEKKGVQELPNTAPAGGRHEHEFISLSGRYTGVEMQPTESECKNWPKNQGLCILTVSVLVSWLWF